MVSFLCTLESPATTTEADLVLLVFPSLPPSPLARSHFPPFRSFSPRLMPSYTRHRTQASMSELDPSRSRKPPPESPPSTLETVRLQHWTPRRRSSRVRCHTRSLRRPKQSRWPERVDTAPSVPANHTFVVKGETGQIQGAFVRNRY